VNESAALLSFDLPHPLEGGVDVVAKLDLGPEGAAPLHPKGAGGLRHHDLRGGAEDTRRIGDGHGVVAGAHRGDAST
jgi:hypothetical protein